MRTRQKVYALHALEAVRREGRTPRFPVEFVAQNGEDIFLWEILGGALEGFFIEAGAFDGYHYSVTYPFEAVGWSGLLVEPLPGPAQLCQARRPHSRTINTALSKTDAAGETTFEVANDIYGGMMSHLSGHGVPRKSVLTMTPITVPVTSLNALLADHQGSVDLVVLDVEGAEFDVLDGFDINRFAPRVLMIEVDPARAAELEKYVQRYPYTRAGNLDANQVFIRKDQAEIWERLKWIAM